MKYDDQGRELPDQTPVARPVNFRPPPSMQELIRQYVRTELSRQADLAGDETFEEADDFDIPDDPPDPSSPWELNFDQVAAPFDASLDEAPQAPQAPSAGADNAGTAPSPPEASTPNPP